MRDPLPKMVRTTPARPCPACQRAGWCLICPTGRSCICQRVESPKKCGEAGWLHRLDKPLPAFEPPPKVEKPRGDWYGPALAYSEALTADRKKSLSRSLGLPDEGLSDLALVGLMLDREGEVFTFPERDGDGKVIGLNRRFPDGRKLHLAGGGRGLTLPNGWEDKPGPIYVVEGPTDTMAVWSAGLCAIGRPSNRGGVAFLNRILDRTPSNRPVVVVGENDRKAGGLWPGLIGAVAVAGELAVKNPVHWVLAPTDYKDVREFLTSERFEGMPWNLRGDILEAELAENSFPARHVPDGYQRYVDSLAKEVGYDESKWRE